MKDSLRISSINVNGYGVFKARAIHPEPGFNLVYGQNEAGKSTLFSFLRGMIGGFPALNKKSEKRYLPVNGGEYGGELEVHFSGQDLTLGKSGKDLSLILAKEELKTFLENINREHYKSIFAFDLSELTALSFFGDDSLNEKLFSSMVDGANDVLSKAILALEKSKGELFRVRAKAKIDHLYTSYVEEEGRLRELELETEERLKRLSELENLDSKIVSLKKYIEDTRIKIEKLKNIKESVKISDALIEEQTLRQELGNLPRLSKEEERAYRELKTKRELYLKEQEELRPEAIDLAKMGPSFLATGMLCVGLYLLNDLSYVYLFLVFFILSGLSFILLRWLESKKFNSLYEEYSNKLKTLDSHPLGHLTDEDVVELLDNHSRLIQSNTKIATLESTLEKLELDSYAYTEEDERVCRELEIGLGEGERKLGELLELKGSLRSDIGKLSTSTKYQEQRQEVHRIKEEIEALLFSYRVDVVSLYILEKSLKRLGEGSFKKVGDLASEMFSELTFGRYVKLSLGEKKNEIVVSDKQGVKYTPDKLSQGAVEQLYLSLRLALVRVSEESFGALPVLLDDVLVNFDKQRARRGLEVLKGISETNQVFYFTCHEWIRDLFMEVVGGGVVEV